MAAGSGVCRGVALRFAAPGATTEQIKAGNGTSEKRTASRLRRRRWHGYRRRSRNKTEMMKKGRLALCQSSPRETQTVCRNTVQCHSSSRVSNALEFNSGNNWNKRVCPERLPRETPSRPAGISQIISIRAVRHSRSESGAAGGRSAGCPIIHSRPAVTFLMAHAHQSHSFWWQADQSTRSSLTHSPAVTKSRLSRGV